MCVGGGGGNHSKCTKYYLAHPIYLYLVKFAQVRKIQLKGPDNTQKEHTKATNMQGTHYFAAILAQLVPRHQRKPSLTFS